MAYFLRFELKGKSVYINTEQIVMVLDESLDDVKQCKVRFTSKDEITLGVTADRFF